MIGWSVAVGAVFAVVLLAAPPCCRGVHGRPRGPDQAAILWPFFAVMQPLGGAVFALDGILIGAATPRT